MGLWKRKTEQGKQTKDQRLKNKIIIIGEYGSGKSYKALNLMSDKKEHALYATDLFLYQRIKRIFQHWEIMRKKVTDNAFPWNKAGNII